MSVDQPRVVDIISRDPAGAIYLTISDHLDWTDTPAHLFSLQEKINKYLAFMESGEIYESYPDAAGRKLIIKIVFQFDPPMEARSFLTKARTIVESAGFSFEFELFSASPWPM
jgi:hypothetical protein